MNALLPKHVAEAGFSRYFTEAGLKRIHQGKVRDMYELPKYPDLLLMVATDRISIFDIVLPALVPQKGEVLTAITHFWLTGPLSSFPNHFDLDTHKSVLKELVSHSSHQLPIFQMLVVKKTRIPPYEFIFRHHLGGSVYKEYAEHGTAAGEPLPPGIPKWGYLEEPIFTPSTKTDRGHDENLCVKDFYAEADSELKKTVEMHKNAYVTAYYFARSRGIIILDTKFEGVIIADEVVTPDSSRFVREGDFFRAMQHGRDPIFYDKEVMREWGRSVGTPWGLGLHRLNPTDKEHLLFAHSLEVPEGIISLTTARYLAIFKKIIFQKCKNLQEYQKVNMGI